MHVCHAYEVYGHFLESDFPRKTSPETVIITLPGEIFVTYFSILNHPFVMPQSVLYLQTGALAGGT